MAPADAGLLRLEGTLGDPNTRAASLAEVPMDLRADWQAAPLVGLSRLALGRDAGLRGDLTLNLHATGTAGHAALTADLKFSQVRRSDFVPAHPLALQAACQAAATNSFQTLSAIECHWPPQDSGSPSVLIGTGSVGDVRNLASATANLTLPALPAATLLDWLQVASPHAPTGLTGPGVLAGTLAWNAPAAADQPPRPTWSGELELAGEILDLPSSSGSNPVPLGDILLRSRPSLPPVSGQRHANATLPGQKDGSGAAFDLLPITIPLGSRQPATLEGSFNGSGYTLRLTGSAQLDRLLALAGALPQFGEGLPEVLGESPSPSGLSLNRDASATLKLDLTATRRWGHPQTWSRTGTSAAAPPVP